MPDSFRIKWKGLTMLAVLSGIIYNSWPLGYWLNPYVAKHDLASELESVGQPFRWLFVYGDIISSVLLIVTAILLLIMVRKSRKPIIISVALANAIAFGIGTIVDALIPLHCDPSIQKCQPYLHNPTLLIHGLFSILASVCLFITMAIFWWLDRRSHLMKGIVFGYALFGIFSIISIVLPGQDNWAQHYTLILDGVCIGFIPFITAQLVKYDKIG